MGGVLFSGVEFPTFGGGHCQKLRGGKAFGQVVHEAGLLCEGHWQIVVLGQGDRHFFRPEEYAASADRALPIAAIATPLDAVTTT